MLAVPSQATAGDFVRQIQIVNGQTVIHDTIIGSEFVNIAQGTILSQPIASSSVFQLYSQVDIPENGGAGLFLGLTVLDIGLDLSLSLFGQNASMKFAKVDEKTVGTFMPDVTIQALSDDPHVPARTRADKPYGIRIQIAGLQPAASTAPDYAKSVQVRRSFRTYDPLIFAPTTATQSGTYLDSFTFKQNGPFVDNAISQRLPFASPTKALGEETFTVYTHPDALAVQSQFASAKVQIWPVATATITGIDPLRTYQEPPSTGVLQVTDLYPKSTTYLQVYKGSPALGTLGTALAETTVAYDSQTPQSAVIPITGLLNAVNSDGVYTIEALTITPFNGGAPERMAYTTFKLDRTIQVNASVVTLEN